MNGKDPSCPICGRELTGVMEITTARDGNSICVVVRETTDCNWTKCTSCKTVICKSCGPDRPGSRDKAPPVAGSEGARLALVPGPHTNKTQQEVEK